MEQLVEGLKGGMEYSRRFSNWLYNKNFIIWGLKLERLFKIRFLYAIDFHILCVIFLENQK